MTASGISIGSKSSDVSKSGVNNSANPEYTNSSKSLSVGTFYGHVYDRAGNTGMCSSEVLNGTLYYNQTTTTCSESYVNHPIKYYTKTSYYCDRTESGTSISCSSGTYPNTGDYCYIYTSGSSYNGCSSGTYSNGSCYINNQTSCSSGWSSTRTSYARYKCTKNPTQKMCTEFSNSYSKCTRTSGCSWSQVSSACLGKYNYCASGSLSGGKCTLTNQTSCSSGWSSTKTSDAKYTCSRSADTCASGWSTCSWCNQSKCKKSTGKVIKTPTYSYSFDSGSNEYNQTSCTDNPFECTSSNYQETKVSCSVSSTVPDYYYEYSPSSSTKSGLASCTPSSEYSSCSGSYKNSQTNQKNKTNVTCAVGGYSCPFGYSRVGSSYCYK